MNAMAIAINLKDTYSKIKSGEINSDLINIKVPPYGENIKLKVFLNKDGSWKFECGGN